MLVHVKSLEVRPEDIVMVRKYTGGNDGGYFAYRPGTHLVVSERIDTEQLDALAAVMPEPLYFPSSSPFGGRQEDWVALGSVFLVRPSFTPGIMDAMSVPVGGNALLGAGGETLRYLARDEEEDAHRTFGSVFPRA